MAGLIPQPFIDEIVRRADIVEIIDARIPLKKAGRDFKACCPFHDEKTPSFTVSPTKQFYHCFGCGAHGTVLRFLMEFERMDFVEAVEALAEQLGLEVPREGRAAGPSAAERSRLDAALAALERAAEFYKRQLRGHPSAGSATQYLKARGLSGRTAAHFELGYAPPGWDNLQRALGEEGIGEAAMLDAGLLAESERSAARRYDRFRDRVVFPIRDRRGRVVGFGARTTGEATPKYLNSPEGIAFHKGRELYGLHQALGSHRRLDALVVVEGYMDVVMLWEHGIDYACATLGTAATPEQMQRLLRASDRVVFCFDGDEAGRRAAWRALENVLELMHDGREARFMFLPQGEDPDSYVRAHGRADFEARLREAPTLTDFLFEELRSRTELRSVEGRARLVDAARPLLAKLPNGALRGLVVDRLAALCQIPTERIEALLGDGARRTVDGGERAPPAARRPREVVTPARRAVTLLIHHPPLAAAAGDVDDLGSLEVPGASVLLELVQTLRETPEMSTGGLVERFRHHAAAAALARLARLEVPELTPTLEEEFLDCLERIRRVPVEARFQELRERDRDGGLSASEKAEFRSLVAARARGR